MQAFRGPLGYTKMVAQVLGSAASSTGVVPTLAQNPGLSVKRVPGFLAGWTVPNLAAPYDVANIPDRTIDNMTVDYWAITLNELDAVLLTIVPTDRPADTGFAVRIWGPDGKEVGTAVPGRSSRSSPRPPAPTPWASRRRTTPATRSGPSPQPAPFSGPTLRTYTAEFQTYPGTNTNTIDILLNYKNPAYTDGNWPAWTAAQGQAYKTLTTIASASSQVPGDLQNFTDFRQVGNQTDPQKFSLWLTATWAPFQNMLDDPNNPDIIANTYHAFPVIQQAYTSVASFADQVANAFLQDLPTQAAYISVNQLLQGANVARSDLYNDYLLRFQGWSTSNQLFLGLRPHEYRDDHDDGADAGDVAQAGRPEVLDRAAARRPRHRGRECGGGDLGALAPGSGPFVNLGVATAGNLIVNAIDAWLDGDFGNPKPPPPPPTRRDIFGAAIDMANAAQDAYKNTFDLLTNQGFLTSVFSNYGLLEALGTIQFTDQITPAEVLQQHYDRSVWEQLLPQMFSWRPVAPTDDGPADTLPNFTFFIPYNEKRSGRCRTAPRRSHHIDGSWSYYPTNGKYQFTCRVARPRRSPSPRPRSWPSRAAPRTSLSRALTSPRAAKATRTGGALEPCPRRKRSRGTRAVSTPSRRIRTCRWNSTVEGTANCGGLVHLGRSRRSHHPPVGPANPRREGWLPGVVPGRRRSALRHRHPRNGQRQSRRL